MNDVDLIRAIRVIVRPIPAAPALAMRNHIVCCCLECNTLRKWLYPRNAAETENGELSLVGCSTLFKLAVAERCDVCLRHAQYVCRSAGDAIAFCSGLSASAKHQLEQSHAIDRDRLDSARVGLWLETAFACRVGAKRGAELYREAIARKVCLGQYLQDHCDEYGLKFVVQTSDAIDKAAVDFLTAIGERDWAGKPN